MSFSESASTSVSLSVLKAAASEIDQVLRARFVGESEVLSIVAQGSMRFQLTELEFLSVPAASLLASTFEATHMYTGVTCIEGGVPDAALYPWSLK